MEPLCILAAVVVVGLVVISRSIRVVPEYQRLVVFRLGRPLERAMGPGLVFLIPSIDRAIKVDLREQKREVPLDTTTTKDFKPVSSAFRWSYQVFDPVKSVLAVGNLETAAAGIASNRFRELVREINSSDLSSEHEYIRSEVAARLDEIMDQCGAKITGLELIPLIAGDREREMENAKLFVGTIGETQSPVYTSGTVLIANQPWDAISNSPIPPNTRVRVKRVVLEVEEDSSK